MQVIIHIYTKINNVILIIFYSTFNITISDEISSEIVDDISSREFLKLLYHDLYINRIEFFFWFYFKLISREQTMHCHFRRLAATLGIEWRWRIMLVIRNAVYKELPDTALPHNSMLHNVQYVQFVHSTGEWNKLHIH